ncbi:hypothetical protein K439DRAFT_545271 [Ramaria rubella]|nr:hypothetical protein K439DRAFT_545271 [Ramaria rubella]
MSMGHNGGRLMRHLQQFNHFDDHCPCTSVIDCKVPGFRVSPVILLNPRELIIVDFN